MCSDPKIIVSNQFTSAFQFGAYPTISLCSVIWQENYRQKLR